MDGIRKRIGNSDLWVTPIGLGCMSFTSEENARELIARALDAGVNFFDTADLYGQGQNEEWVGKVLKHRRHDVILATKVGNRWEPGKPGWWWGPTKEYILQAVKDSLRRLQTDYIDLYQLHGGTLDDPIDDIIEAFERLKAEGVIRYYGISSIRPNVIREYVKRSNIVSVMMQYSLLDRRPEESVLDLLHEHGISVIARGPVAKGWLTTRGRAGDEGYLDYATGEIQALREALKRAFPDGPGLTQLAFDYIFSHPVVAVAIPGASQLSQLEENLGCIPPRALSQAELERIRALLKSQRYEAHR
jgi:aryl-alcohol dehydrogenase-like predicted oxidoreductase